MLLEISMQYPRFLHLQDVLHSLCQFSKKLVRIHLSLKEYWDVITEELVTRFRPGPLRLRGSSGVVPEELVKGLLH